MIKKKKSDSEGTGMMSVGIFQGQDFNLWVTYI